MLGARRSSFRSSQLIALAAALVTVASAPPARSQPPEPPSLSVAFEASSIVLTGAAEGDRLALLGVGRARTAYRSRMLRFDGVVTAGAEGTARYALPDDQPVPVRSVWAVVDLGDGAVTLAVPEGAVLRRVEAPRTGLGAAARVLEQEVRALDVLLVRPASGPGGSDDKQEEEAGLWALRTADGGTSDADRQADGRLSLRYLDLLPLAGSGPAPESLAPKDVLIGVDPESLEVWAVQLATPPDDEGGA